MTAIFPKGKDHLPEGHLKVLAREYELERWITSKSLADSKRLWFETIDDLYRGLRRLHRSADRQDSSLRDLLASGLADDGSFKQYLFDRRATQLADEGGWANARMAMAGVIMNLYSEACASAEWTPGRGRENAA